VIYIRVSQRKEIPMANKVTMLVYLDPDVRDRLKELAEAERVSMALLIRRAIDQYLKGLPRKRGAR
jgi:Ribbon-helix-helix protein, copG family